MTSKEVVDEVVDEGLVRTFIISWYNSISQSYLVEIWSNRKRRKRRRRGRRVGEGGEGEGKEEKELHKSLMFLEKNANLFQNLSSNNMKWSVAY